MSLSSFLSQNAVVVENVKLVVSNRFLDENLKPSEWEIRAISATEDEALRAACVKRVPVVGKKGQYTQETDVPAYLGKFAVACTVYPDLTDKDLQDSYHVMGAEALLKKMLTSGEYSAYLDALQANNGFDQSLDDKVETAKN